MADELTITRDGNRVTVAGDVRTPADPELLKERVDEALLPAIDLMRHLEEHLAGNPPPTNNVSSTIVLDVSKAGYFDSNALITLVAIAKKCVEAGSTLVLERVNEDLREQLHATHIDEVLTIVAKRAKAPPAP
jgi:anti-anti-sigma regulatory factor